MRARHAWLPVLVISCASGGLQHSAVRNVDGIGSSQDRSSSAGDGAAIVEGARNLGRCLLGIRLGEAGRATGNDGLEAVGAVLAWIHCR